MKPRTCLPVFLAVVFASLVSLFPERSLAASTTTPTDVSGSSVQTTAIPGPLRSFLRMAGISQKVGNEDILPLLARNVFAHGYEGWQDNRRPTEFLILLNRYVQQARELAALAGPEGTIHIANCDEAKPLLEILGYRFRQDCGKGHTTVETAEATRAFLTMDSGFPVSDLERDLDANQPFSYPYPTSRVPVLLSEDDWKAKESGGQVRDVVDALLRSPGTARFYWAMSRVDPQTRLSLRQSPGLERLVPYASVLDFYGPHIVIRNGRVLVPGGSSAEAAWQDLVGANPDAASDFVIKLISKDKGWLAAYFDALSRVNSAQQARLTEPKRLRAFYEALREENASIDAARPVFRPDPGLLLLVTRLQWDAGGEPVVPGGIEAWKKIFHQKNDSKLVRSWSKKASHWNSPEQLVEALFALSRADTDAGPLQIYLLTSELDMRRPADRRLSQQTVALMGEHFAQYSNQFLIFSEFPGLNDESIAAFLTTAAKLDGIGNQVLRGNALGMFQAEIGLWQILARQNQIPEDRLNSSMAGDCPALCEDRGTG